MFHLSLISFIEVVQKSAFDKKTSVEATSRMSDRDA